MASGECARVVANVRALVLAHGGVKLQVAMGDYELL